VSVFAEHARHVTATLSHFGLDYSARPRRTPSTNKPHPLRCGISYVHRLLVCRLTLQFGSAAFHDFNDRLLLGSTDLTNRIYTFLLMTYDGSSVRLAHTNTRPDVFALCCQSWSCTLRSQAGVAATAWDGAGFMAFAEPVRRMNHSSTTTTDPRSKSKRHTCLTKTKARTRMKRDGRSCAMMMFACQTSKRNLRLVFLYFIPGWVDGFQSGSSIQYTFWASHGHAFATGLRQGF
jgi:hypothetical protein